MHHGRDSIVATSRHLSLALALAPACLGCCLRDLRAPHWCHARRPRALPPLRPSLRPRLTAEGVSFPCSSGAGSRSLVSPVAMSTMDLESWLASWGRLHLGVYGPSSVAPPSVLGRRKEPDSQSCLAPHVCIRPAHQRGCDARSGGDRWCQWIGSRHRQGQQRTLRAAAAAGPHRAAAPLEDPSQQALALPKSPRPRVDHPSSTVADVPPSGSRSWHHAACYAAFSAP